MCTVTNANEYLFAGLKENVTLKYTEELKKEIGNAIAAYDRILHSALLGTDVPHGFEKLKECTEEELKHKIRVLREFYSQL